MSTLERSSLFRECFQKIRLKDEKLISEAEYGSKNIPLTVNLISLSDKPDSQRSGLNTLLSCFTVSMI